MDKTVSSFHFIAIIIKDCELKCVYVENKIPVIQDTIFQLVNLFFVMKILGFFFGSCSGNVFVMFKNVQLFIIHSCCFFYGASVQWLISLITENCGFCFYKQ